MEQLVHPPFGPTLRVSPCPAKAGKLKITFLRFLCSYYSAWELSSLIPCSCPRPGGKGDVEAVLLLLLAVSLLEKEALQM